jgi:hypothetical protein
MRWGKSGQIAEAVNSCPGAEKKEKAPSGPQIQTSEAPDWK